METTDWSAGGRWLKLSGAYLALLVASILALLAWSGNLEAQEAGGLPFFVDTASFKALGDSGKSYVEIYILLSSKSLEFQEEEGEYWARLGIKATIRGSNGQEKWSNQWRRSILMSSEETLEQGTSIFDIAGLILEPDLYSLRVDLEDERSGQTGFVTGELDVTAFPPDTLFISQVELALEITATEEEGDFVKNGLRVLPNPIRIYGPRTPVLYFYVEIYGLLLEAGLDSTYTIQQEILTSSGDLVKNYEPKTKRKPGKTSVEVGGISVVALEPGTYLCRIKVRDDATGIGVYSQRQFRVASPEEDVGSLFSGEVVMTPEEAELQQNVIHYIASKQELKAYQGLSLEGKARFLEDFWQRQDPDPTTPQNEFKEEHLRRWNYANRQFSRFQVDDGWKSDRGRVFIIYGPPDEIERHPSDAFTVAWECWYYYSLEGGIRFIFADLGGIDKYDLLHSDARNEFHDREWETKISH